MLEMTGPYLRKAAGLVTLAVVCMATGCSSDPEPPELTPSDVSALITEKWSRNELNHFTVTFHSDTLIECGIQNGLWKRVENVHQGMAFTTYQLTEAGRKAVFAIDLKESGRSHEIILQGPYALELRAFAVGSQPDQRQVTMRWDLDWDKAPAGLKACVPRFEMTGTQVALFQLFGQEWRFMSFLKPADAAPPPQAVVRSQKRSS